MVTRSYANVVKGTSHKINQKLEKILPKRLEKIPNISFENNNDYRLLFIGAKTFLQDAYESDKNDIFEKDYNVLEKLLFVGDQRDNNQKNLTKEQILKEYKKILEANYSSNSSKLKAFERFIDYGNFFWKEMSHSGSDYVREGIYVTTNNKGTQTQGGRLWFALFKQWDDDLSEGWKESNKGGIGNKKKIEFLLKNNRLVNFIKEHRNQKIYKGLAEVFDHDQKGFINLLKKIVETTNYNKRAFYLYKYLKNYGNLPDFYTRKGDNGTILSPLYSVYYELNKPKKTKTKHIRKEKTKTKKSSVRVTSNANTDKESVNNSKKQINNLSTNNSSTNNLSTSNSSRKSLNSHLNSRTFANVVHGVPKSNQ